PSVAQRSHLKDDNAKEAAEKETTNCHVEPRTRPAGNRCTTSRARYQNACDDDQADTGKHKPAVRVADPEPETKASAGGSCRHPVVSLAKAQSLPSFAKIL